MQLLHRTEVFGEEDFISDQLIVYLGMYGVPSYCLWYAASDKTKIIEMGLIFRLSFYREANDLIYVEDFMIKSAMYDSVTQHFKIYAESRAFYEFEKNIGFTFKEWSTKNKREPDAAVSPKIVLGTVLMKTNPDIAIVFVPPITERKFYLFNSFDSNFSVLDFVTKVCAENQWEWYLRGDAIFISDVFTMPGNELYETDRPEYKRREINTLDYTYVQTIGDAAIPGLQYKGGAGGRVLWVIHQLGGKIGHEMKICIYKTHTRLREEHYIESLVDYARQLGLNRLQKNYTQKQILIGNIFGEYTDEERNNYEAAEFGADIDNPGNSPADRLFKNKYEEGDNAFIYLKKPMMTSPYAGNGVGLQFPQADSHRILFSPFGNREYALVGPAYWANEDVIPERYSEKDYRLSLPGATIYIKEDGEIIIEQSSIPGSVPSGSGNYIKIDTDGTIYIDSSNQINIGDSATVIRSGGPGALVLSQGIHQHPTGNLGIIIPPGSPNTTKVKGA